MAIVTSASSAEPARRVFLSSTSRDLAEHRQVVVRRCSALGYAMVAMEEFGAQDGDASLVSVEAVRECDVFVGVYARRYGYVPDGAVASVTEMEYDEATRLGKPRLLFVVDPGHVDHPLLEQHRDDTDPRAGAGLARFLGRVGRERVWDVFTSPDHLAERVVFALSGWEGWTPPRAPALTQRVVGCSDLLVQMSNAMLESGRVALGGIGGIGKSQAALQFAHQFADFFKAGVFWVTLGTGATDAESTLAATVRAWMSCHHPGRLADPETLAPGTVRAWLEALPERLLVVLDDVWHAESAIEILRLIPPRVVVVTSRRGDVVRRLGIDASIEVTRLPEAESLEMLRDRGDMPSRTALREVARVLDGHPLALDVAAAWIRREGPDFADGLPARLQQAIATRTSSGVAPELDMPAALGATRDATYVAMGSDLKRRYRALGALAPDAPITPFLMAGLWSVEVDAPEALDDAVDRMHALAKNAVLSRTPGRPVFSQHGLVRAHARRLLGLTAEADAMDDRYARTVCVLAKEHFSGPAETWEAMADYLAHVAFVGDAMASRLEARLGPLAPLASPAAAARPLPFADVASLRLLLLPALSFATTTSPYLRDRAFAGASAARWLRMGVVAARGLGEKRWLATLHADLGTWEIRHGEPKAAIARFTSAAQIAQDDGDAALEISTRQRLADALIGSGRHDEAEVLLESLSRRSSETEDRVQEGAIEVTLGTLQRRRGDAAGALQSYANALRHVGEGDIGARATILNNIGVTHRQLGDPRTATQVLELARAAHRRLGDRREESITLGNLAGVAWDTWDLERAKTLYGEALDAARDVGDRRQQASTLVNLGTVSQKAGDDAGSIAYQEEALVIFRELGDPAGEAAALNNIATSILARDPRTALTYLQESLALNRQLGDRRAEGKVLNVIGDAWYALRDAGQAHQAYQAALMLTRAVGDRGAEALVLQNLGILAHALKDVVQAEQHYIASLALMRAIGNRNGEAVNLSNLASIAFTSGDPDGARSLLRQALAIMRDIGDSRSARAIEHNLQELEREAGAEAPRDPTPTVPPASPSEEHDLAELLTRFLESEGPSRAIYYAKNAARLQSAEARELLEHHVARSREAGDQAGALAGQQALDLLARLRAS